MPLFSNHSIEDFPIGNRSFSDHQAGLALGDLQLHPQAWLGPIDHAKLLDSKARTLVDGRQTPIAWLGSYPDPAESLVATDSFLVIHPWDLLRANEIHLATLDKPVLEAEIHSSAVIDGIAHIAKGTRILPGVYIEGNVVIGPDCKIGPNCYLRGNTSIGANCHIGQSVEIKNSIILSNTNVGHLSYVGDSILGEKVNLGAGTMTSNLRHDGKNHRSMVDGSLVDTGRRKLGCIIGDGVHTGINTSIYPGRKLFPGTSTRPGEIVQHDLHPS